MASPPTIVLGQTQPWLHNLMQKKPEQIVADWVNQFRTLETPRSNDHSGHGSGGGSGKSKSRYMDKLWGIDDPISKKKFYISRGPKLSEVHDFYETFVKLGITTVMNFARLHEGPLGPGGAADFDDALYFPCTPGEIAHFVIDVGEITTAEVIVTNVRVTMINDVVAHNDLELEVNVDIKKAVVGECHTIEPHQSTQIAHIQHFNWPPDEQPWCTDSILQTLSSLHRMQTTSVEGPEKPVNILLLCADGHTRSGAFAALNHCIVRTMIAQESLGTSPFHLNEVVKEAVSLLRAQCPEAMRNERIFTWLNYAVVEHCVKRLVESATDKKESKRACDWLAKLRNKVYLNEREKKSALGNISLMG